MGSSRFREWVEAKLPWYSPHDERLRNVHSEEIARETATTVEDAKRIMGRDQAIIDAYREADEKLRKR